MTSDDEPGLPQSPNVSGDLPAGHINLTPYGFHRWAEDFLAAEKAYASGARRGSFVAHFLCCQSMELSLKAFLSLKGMTRKDLRQKRLGHNLLKLFEEACRQGIRDFVAIDGHDASILQEATAWYDKGKRFQYFELEDVMSGWKDAPDLAGLEGLATRLQSRALRAVLTLKA